MEILIRMRTSTASCGHVIKNGEKYLLVAYRGVSEFGSYRTFCKNCAERYVTEMSEELKKVATP